MNKYQDLFEKIINFQKKQDLQKKRGLNDYNMVNVVRKINHEVGMHSNIIYSLINPNGQHYQDDLFLKLFIKNVLLTESIKNVDSFGDVLEVEAEESTDKKRRIDFTIKTSNYYIGIEMKVDAPDLNRQIYDYNKYLKELAKKDNNQDVIIFYLTKYGKDAQRHSKCIKENDKYIECVDIQQVSFDKHILNWINDCQKEIYNITNLNDAFENYKNIVRKVTNKYDSKVMKMNEFLDIEDNKEKYLKTIFEMKYSIHEILGKQLFNLFVKIDEHVSNVYDKKNVNFLINKASHIYNTEKCENWFYNDEKIKGNQKVECIGSFYELSDNTLLRIEVATRYFHIGVVSYKKCDDGYVVIEPQTEIKNLESEGLEERKWKWAHWYSKSFGDFINPNEENIKCYQNFDDCFIKSEIKKIIQVVSDK